MRMFPDVNGLSVPRAAMAYVDAGIPVVPFDPSIGNGKQCGNLVGGGSQPWYQLVSTDKSQIRAWRATFGRFQALATSPGAINAVVLDVDTPAEVPKSWRKLLDAKTVPYVNSRPQEHAKRGHYWFSLPTGASPVGNGSHPWGEVRSHGGGIVLPPNGDRTVIRCGEAPTLPDEIYAGIAGAEQHGGAISLASFFTSHQQETKAYKLAGLEAILRREVEKTGSRHDAARTALTVGFGESRLGYVSAQNVYDLIKLHWQKSSRELRSLARWAAGVALAQDLEEIRAKSDRGPRSDSRQSSAYFARKTG